MIVLVGVGSRPQWRIEVEALIPESTLIEDLGKRTTKDDCPELGIV
jgi:hypothetical protein